ncbi:MAG: preprotein translocase subunit SecG [Devosia sp.]
MANVLIVAYLLIVLALIAVILLQRSEGGGLGMGGNAGGLMTVRGSANLLTRTTGILAALFFATAIGLTILTEIDRPSQSILDRAADGIGGETEAPTSVLDALNALQGETTPAAPATDAAPTTTDTTTPAADPALAVPTTEAPAADAAPASGTDTQSGSTTTPAAPTN